MTQRVLVAKTLNYSPQGEIDELLAKLGKGWRIVSANTTCTVFGVKNDRGVGTPPTHEAWFITTIVVEKTISDDQKKYEQVLKQGVDSLPLSARAKSALHYAEIRTIGQLVAMPELDVRMIRNCGVVTRGQIRRSLEKIGLSFGMNIQND